MGTRADFYVGRGEEAEWLGSVAWDGYQGGFDAGFFGATTEVAWREAVAAELAGREDATTPEMGWPWPWEDSNTTDYSYTFDDGRVWGTAFGHGWWDATQPEPDDDAPKSCTFPDMTERKNVSIGSKRSGIMLIGANGPEEE